jgi:hypothetical protein
LGGLAKGYAEFGHGHGIDHGFVQVLHRLDEMGLTKDTIHVLRFFKGYGQ